MSVALNDRLGMEPGMTMGKDQMYRRGVGKLNMDVSEGESQARM